MGSFGLDRVADPPSLPTGPSGGGLRDGAGRRLRRRVSVTRMSGTTETSTPKPGKTVAFLVAAEGVERAELVEPWQAVTDAGHRAVLLSPKTGEVQLFEHLDKADTRSVDQAVGGADVADFDALVLPGGVANPDALRTDEQAVAFVREFVESGKPVAAICHAPWTLIEADVVRGLRITSWPSLRTDLRNAGATWVDEQVVVDRNVITSRNPGDIPAFANALLEAVNHGVSSAAAVA